MQRYASNNLEEWRLRSGRKPLVICGARQVGKSHLVRQFAAQNFDSLIEVDFERDPKLGSLFASGQPSEILQQLELQFDTDVVPGKTLLFLDEIQASIQVLPTLRYFYEELPELHIIAAGSLLDFALADHQFSMPVGRIEYLHMGPMHFEEFLLARGRERLCRFLKEYQIGETFSSALHHMLMGELRQYLVVGGMPEVIATYGQTGSMRESDRVKHSLLTTFEDDFSRYQARANHQRLRKLFRRIPQMIGTKFKYVNVDREERSKNLAATLQMLNYARVCHSVRHSVCEGVPLGAGASDRHFKVLYLDVGLASTACGLSLLDFREPEDVMLVNAGGICKQFVGQHLLYSQACYQKPELYYWMREKRNSSAEVDYVVACANEVVPVEVKSGKAGTLRSLHLFMKEKGRKLGVRLNSDAPSVLETLTANAAGTNTPFHLLSLPLYMVGQILRLSRSVLDQRATS